MTEDQDTTPLGPHWWDVFNEPRSQPVVKPPRPRWLLVIGALIIVVVAVVLTYPVPTPLNGN